MDDLKSNAENKKFPVSAKKLYDFLEMSKAHWKKWYIKNIIENPFVIKGKDWEEFTLGVKTIKEGRPTKDFNISIDFAKKLFMKADGEKGNAVREHFLRMEKIAKQIFNPTPSIEDHAKKEIQIKNSKEVNAYQYRLGGVESVIDYNRMNCKLHTGKLPHEIKAEAKRNKLPSKMRTSAKEVLRNIDPVTACSMSLTDDMVKMGGNLDEAAHLSNTHGRAIFSYMLKNGIIPGELRK